MAARPLTVRQVLDLLADHPRQLGAVTAGLDPDALRRAPRPGEWSANDVLAHLRACSDTWGGQIAAMLAEDAPTLRAVNPRTWMVQTDYPDLPFAPSLDAFAAQRTALLDVLEGLSDDRWARTATLVGAGRPLQRTVLSVAQGLAVHERTHVRQLRRAVEAGQPASREATTSPSSS